MSHSAEGDVTLSKNTQGVIEAIVIAKRTGLKEARERLGRSVNIDRNERSWGHNVLYLRAALGENSDVKTILALGANPDSRSDDGETPLLRAVLNKHRNVAKSLLAAGADPGIRSKSGLSALLAAVFANNAKMLKILLEGGADANEATLDHGLTPLHAAAVEGNRAAAKVLIKYGADINAESDSGATPLGAAIGEGNRWTARLLRKHGGLA